MQFELNPAFCLDLRPLRHLRLFGFYFGELARVLGRGFGTSTAAR